jgi:hypothetical protein
MRVRNDGEDAGSGTYPEIIRLQSEFYTRLTEETLKYLRRLQATAMPAAPGTVVMPEGNAALNGSGAPGDSITLQVEIENRQRVHCVVTPMLSPLVHTSGATWFPSAEFEKTSVLIAPEQVETIAMKFAVPAKTPEGTFRGMLLLQGFRENAVPVAIDVKAAPGAVPAAAKRIKKAAAKKTTRRKTAGKGKK